MPQTLNLTPFYGIDSTRLSEEDLHTVRTDFATAVCDFAFTCETNEQFIEGLTKALPSGLPYLAGEGSCRRVYLPGRGVVIKLLRQDDLDPKELAWRGGRSYLPILQKRRHLSQWNEIHMSSFLPNATARIYGAALSFWSERPSIIVSEAVRPLDHYYPNDNNGVLSKHLHIRASDGGLIISDPRFSNENPCESDLCLDVYPHDGGVWLGNLGFTNDSRFVLIDTGDFSPSMRFAELDEIRREYKMLSIDRLAQDKLLTEFAMSRYRTERRKIWQVK